MRELHSDLLQCIGNTPMVSLRSIVPRNGLRILLKLEFHNPTGGMKDRMALAMIEGAEADGRLQHGGSVIEYTVAAWESRCPWSVRSKGTHCTS